MQRRSYGQYCSLAKALDLVGDRWTLLILRDLLAGPRRFKDMLKGLPGIGSNLLSSRLKFLEEQGLIAKTDLPAPVSSMGYVLQPRGRDLESALKALARWGVPLLLEKGEDLWRPEWNVLALKARFQGHLARDFNATLLLEIDGYSHYLVVEDGSLSIHEGVPPKADVRVSTTGETFLALFHKGTISLAEAEQAGRVEVEGDRALLARIGTVFR